MQYSNKVPALDTAELYIGLMSGTSLDAVDAVLLELPPSGNASPRLGHHYSLPYSTSLRSELLQLHKPSDNELERSLLIGNTLSRLYAETVAGLLESAALPPSAIRAIGCHGQTIRHRPELGYTLQLVNSALLAEQCDITVVADFRSRDIAAGGQGAPLVPAFHHAMFSSTLEHRVILNIGGIANLSNLPLQGEVTGWDSGPGNMLMDAWIMQQQGLTYDQHGAWAETGQIIPDLLASLLALPYFGASPPKSCGRDQFHMDWLQQQLIPGSNPADVQRTLLELSAISITDAITGYCGAVDAVYLCGGGAYNTALARRLQQLLGTVRIETTAALGIAPEWVEAAAFAWLARQTMHRSTGNLPAVTGARGPRVLGAIYYN